MSDITTTIAQPRRHIHIRKGKLTCVAGPDAGQSWLVDRDVVQIGSLPENDVALKDSTVSRRHAEIVRTREGTLLRDCASTNGTFANEMRVREVFLTPETRFRIGKTEMVFTPDDEIIEITPSNRNHLDAMVGRSYAMREVFAIIERVAPTDLTVMITGETGTGKELASRAVHNLSHRSAGPFRVFDCGAAPETLIESELFGHERGAFTGAHASREGLFESANGGTIFLDEIGELPIQLQPKLLRVLEQREVRRVGSGRTRKVDVRVVAATNRDLAAEVQKGTFREDLFYRLAVVEIRLPPLRERLMDMESLVTHFLGRVRHPHSIVGLAPEILQLFESYHWPGNVRELNNVIMRAVPFSNGPLITLDALPEALRAPSRPRARAAAPPRILLADRPFKDAKEELIDGFERAYLTDLIERNGGNISRAARAAGMDRKSIARLLKKHGIR